MTSRTHAVPVWVALLLSGLAGMLVAGQSRLNGGLSLVIGNGFLAAAISFGGGLLLMFVVLALSRAGRRGLGRIRGELQSGHLPRWVLLGGVGGACFVLGQGLVVPFTGVALFTVGVVAGQVLGGLVFDLVGLGPAGKVPITPGRAAGAVLAVIAVAVSAFSGVSGFAAVLFLLVPVVLGVLIAAQSMVNGITRAAAQSTVTATLINFIVGTTVLAIAAAVSLLVSGWPSQWPSEPIFYLGGVVGALFIAIASMMVRIAGVLLLSMSNVAGQLIAAVLFEAVLPIGAGLTIAMAVGSVIGLVAVIIAAVPRRRPLRES